jgi:hypothetical protein
MTVSDLVKVRPLEWRFDDLMWHASDDLFNAAVGFSHKADAERHDAARATRILAALDLSAVEALEAENKRLREAMVEALPWVEAQLDDPVNKPGTVRAVAARIRATLEGRAP